MTAAPRLCLAVLLLCACRVGPDYERPTVATAATFKEAAGWQPATPADALRRGAWWQMFGDAVLDDLEHQLDGNNLAVALASAQFRAALAQVDAARAGLWPTVAADASAQRSRVRAGSSGAGRTTTNLAVSLTASWEPDLFGRIGRQVEAGTAVAAASAADLESARLAAEATLAADYLLLRTADAQRRLLDDTVANYERSLQLVQNRFAQGVVSRADVAQAQAQLDTARAQALDVDVQRAQLEHAIAVLLGKPPAELTIAPGLLPATVPALPPGLPSELLERRPDIAAAERRVAAANADIGVAVAAFYPALTLSAAGGFAATNLSHWLEAPARFWSFGPALAETLFDGGARGAAEAGARAGYDAAVASYRQTVLDAFAEVEDQVAALRILEQEAAVQDRAVAAARQSVTIAENQYRAGTISYLDVVTVQSLALADERAAVLVLGRRQAASVALIKALGGGWNRGEMQTDDAAGAEVPRPSR